MLQENQKKTNQGQGYRRYASSASSAAVNDKLRVGFPDELKVVYLDVQDGTKFQPF